MLLPAALSRTWDQDDDWHGDWHDDYYANPPKHLSRRNQQTTQKSPAKLVTKQRHQLDNPSSIPKTQSLSQSTAPRPKIAAEEITINARQAPPSHQPSGPDQESQARFDMQFGPIGSQEHRYVSKHMGGELAELIVDEPPLYYLITTYISYMILIAFGRIRDFFGIRFKSKQYKHIKAADGYTALNSDFDNFYFRRLKTRMNDCFSRPYGLPFSGRIISLTSEHYRITGVPGRYITLIDRKSSDGNKNFQFTGTYTETLNMSSYNYLDFAQSEGPCATPWKKAFCDAERVLRVREQMPVHLT